MVVVNVALQTPAPHSGVDLSIMAKIPNLIEPVIADLRQDAEFKPILPTRAKRPLAYLLVAAFQNTRSLS
jgi:hypothetical protein